MSRRALHLVPAPRAEPGSRLAAAEAPAHSASPGTAILLAEADPDIGRAIAGQLRADGYEPVLARSSEHAQALAEMRAVRLAILGELESARAPLELLELIRGARGSSGRGGSTSLTSDLPVIVLCSTARELDMLRAFDAGTDDFLRRPPKYLELRARMQALLRRAAAADPGVQLHVAGLTVDLDTRTARLDGRLLQLRRMEYELLAKLAGDPARVFLKQELLAAVWGYRAACTTRTLDSHASRLRRKLRAHDDRHWIVSVRGVGYRLI